MSERIQTEKTPLFLWMRRAAAVLIAAIFLPVAVLAITFSGARSVIIEPDALIDALVEADFYGYVHEHLVPPALDEVYRQANHDLVRVTEPWKGDVALSVKEAFPARDIQEETESALRTVWPYLRGAEDEFEFVIPIAPRASRGFDELSRRVSQENEAVYVPLMELLRDGVREEAATYSVDQVDIDEVVDTHLTEIAPSEWLFPRLGQAVADVGAYYIGETENPEITIPVDDRAEAIQGAIVDIFARTDIDDTSLSDAVIAGVESTLQAEELVVPGLGDVDAELVAGFILDEIPRDELDRAAAQVIGDVAAYAVGLSDVLLVSDVELSLARARANAPNAIAAEADSRLEAEFEAVPACQTAEEAIFPMPDSIEDILPPCVLAGMTYADYRQVAGLDAQAIVREETRRMIPASISITADDVWAALDSGETDLIERVREAVAQGVTADAANLTAELSKALYGDPDQLREYVRAGVTISDQDVEDAFADADGSALEAARVFLSSSGAAQIWLWVIAAMALFLLAFVGGRGWEGRLTWASIVLGISAILAWLLATVPIDLFVRPALEEWANSLIMDFTDDAATELVTRVETLITALLDDVSNKVRSQAIRVGVVAGVALVIARLLAPAAVGRRAAGR